MFTSLYAKLAGFALVLVALLGLFLWGHHVGAASVQARWDAAKAVQTVAVEKLKAENAAHVTALQDKLTAALAKYEDVIHAQPPSVADSVAAGVRDGSLRLRDAAPDTCRGLVPAATARARAADAAATAALAQRVQDSLAAVRVGDAADQREAKLRAQVIGLQDVVRAERMKQ